MSSDASKPTIKLPIEGIFSNELLEEQDSRDVHNRYEKPKGIQGKPTSELVTPPNDKGVWKLAYDKLYPPEMPDFEIELDQIKKYEAAYKSSTTSAKKEALESLKFHYLQAVFTCSPKYAQGWNRWSDAILDMFLTNRRVKVLWGSGNCGKSAVMGLLIYIKWRVNPAGRMIIIASKVVKDASARVFGYLQEVHADAPKSYTHRLGSKINDKEKTIYHEMPDKNTGKWMKNERGCIVSIPVKVDAKTTEVGSNLLGRHPDDYLGLCFDEAQELPAKNMEKIFSNWLTNENVEIFAWGNPQPVDYYAKETHDVLFNMGASGVQLNTLRDWQKQSDQTFTKTNSRRHLLHLSMMDSPKDDPEERLNKITNDQGITKHRLHFIAGKDQIEEIKGSTPVNSPAWYSQVLGFPYMDTSGETARGILTPVIVRKCKEYGLKWHTPDNELEWFMGVDPSISGYGDDCSIVVGRMGIMLDGRTGIDLLSGRYCKKVRPTDEEDFIDTTINTMYTLSQELNIPLRNIAIETHGIGDVFRYALQSHIEAGKWAGDVARGENYHIPDPTQAPSDRMLFKSLGKMKPSKEIVDRRTTEYWLATRCAFLNRQIHNVPDFIINQFYNRYFVPSGNGTKYKLETKQAMKKRGVSSPDDADALNNLIDVCRLRGFKYTFYNKGGYTDKYGHLADARATKEQIEHRMGIVTRMLQINTNLGASKKRKFTKYNGGDV